ncbi:small integral membrane protein 26-like [Sardina pilchardus]|uniref:small integral membrane protein 26-like n=1 Tax=Sardina pilchardus TaxID=27697 RepID=UPI002E11B501
MPISDVFKWKKRASLMYAIGAWTVCGSLAYYKYYNIEPLVTATPVEEDKGIVEKYKGDYHKTTVVYREDFVPYSSRLLNFLKGPSTEDSPAAAEDLKDET